MHIHLDEGRVTDAAEAVNLSRLDHENVAGARFEFLSVDGPETAAFPHELDFIIRMSMWPGTTPGKSAEEENGDVHVSVIRPNEMMRAALEGQVLLTNAMHPDLPIKVGYFDNTSPSASS
jgi:hypothetical protein